MKKEFNERCPACGNEEDNFLMGFGENLHLYYHCENCHHDFVINGGQYASDALEQDHADFHQ